MKNIYTYFIAVFFCAVLTACGGSSGGGSDPTPTPTPTPQPADPTMTVSFTNNSTDVNTETLIADISVTEVAESFTFELNGITGHLVVNGTKIQIENNTIDVSSYAAKEFQLFVTHDVAETVNINLTGFSVAGKYYTATYNQDIIFNEVVNPLRAVTLQLYAGKARMNTDNYSQMSVGDTADNLTFYIENLDILIKQKTRDDKSYTDYQHHENVSITDGKIVYDLPEENDYIFYVTGSHTINGQEILFKGSHPLDLLENFYPTVTFGISSTNVTPEMMDIMDTYNQGFTNGEMKNITMYEILPHLGCEVVYDYKDYVLTPSSSLEIIVDYVCQQDASYKGMEIASNLPVRADIKFSSNTDSMSYNIANSAFENQTANLYKGNNQLKITLDNVSYSDELLTLSLIDMSIHVTTVIWDINNINIDIRIEE